jgi:cytochrome b involved in lipid metabolism
MLKTFVSVSLIIFTLAITIIFSRGLFNNNKITQNASPISTVDSIPVESKEPVETNNNDQIVPTPTPTPISTQNKPSEPKSAPTPTPTPAPSPTPSPAPTPPPAPAPTPTPPPANTVTLNTSEIAKHNAKNDCWFIINSKVYNVTNYLNIHPGGSKTMTPYCGKDATSAFNDLPHSNSASNLLINYLLGDLNQVITL